MGYPRFIGSVENNRFSITDEEFHHAKVRRVKEGFKIEINDLQGNIYLGQIEKIGKKSIEGIILEKIPQQEQKLSIQLFLAMPNRLSKIDELIEPITELGVKELIPVISENTAVKQADIIKKIPKWEKISLNSIKQCKRLFPVKIHQPIYPDQIQTNSQVKVVFYEKEKNRTMKKFLNKTADSVAIYIGAEGGITEKEIKLLKEKGFLSVSLGNLILRMETAVISAVCQTNFIFNL